MQEYQNRQATPKSRGGRPAKKKKQQPPPAVESKPVVAHNKMGCPDCGAVTRVLRSVRYKDHVEREMLHRTRKCDECGKRFVTTEEPVDSEEE